MNEIVKNQILQVINEWLIGEKICFGIKSLRSCRKTG